MKRIGRLFLLYFCLILTGCGEKQAVLSDLCPVDRETVTCIDLRNQKSSCCMGSPDYLAKTWRLLDAVEYDPEIQTGFYVPATFPAFWFYAGDDPTFVFLSEDYSQWIPEQSTEDGTYQYYTVRNPEKLKELIDEGIIDYVAMDIKNSPEKYAITAGATQDIVAKVRKSVDILLNGDIDYEFRTTVTGNLHTVEDMRSIGEWIKGAKAYYLQPFKDSGDIVAGAEKASDFDCSTEHAKVLSEAVKPFLPNTVIRG